MFFIGFLSVWNETFNWKYKEYIIFKKLVRIEGFIMCLVLD